MTGTEIAGSGIYPFSFVPTFSVDGSMLVFNSVEAATTSDGGHTLAVMDFDRTSNRFSNPRELYRNAMLFPSWPFFLPDVMLGGAGNVVDYGKRVVFALVSNGDLVTGAAIPPPTPQTGGSLLGRRRDQDGWALESRERFRQRNGLLAVRGSRSESKLRPDSESGRGWRLLLGVLHQQTQLRQLACQSIRRWGSYREEDLGGCARHRSRAWHRSESPRVLFGQSGARVGQYPRIRRARAVPEPRRQLHQRCGLLLWLLREPECWRRHLRSLRTAPLLEHR